MKRKNRAHFVGALLDQVEEWTGLDYSEPPRMFDMVPAMRDGNSIQAFFLSDKKTDVLTLLQGPPLKFMRIAGFSDLPDVEVRIRFVFVGAKDEGERKKEEVVALHGAPTYKEKDDAEVGRAVFSFRVDQHQTLTEILNAIDTYSPQNTEQPFFLSDGKRNRNWSFIRGFNRIKRKKQTQLVPNTTIFALINKSLLMKEQDIPPEQVAEMVEAGFLEAGEVPDKVQEVLHMCVLAATE